MFGSGKLCPTHQEPMSQQREGNVTVDVCGYGCVFFDPGELPTYLAFVTQGQGGFAAQQFAPPVPHGRRVRDPHAYAFGRRSHGGGHYSGTSPDSFVERIFGGTS